MKKFLALTLALVMSLSLLTACSDPIADELTNFVNVDMVAINENYEAIKAEAATWSNLETIEQLVASTTDTLLPLVNDSLAKLDAIVLETEEVGALKGKFVAVMQAYKEGFELILQAAQNNDEAIMQQGNDKIAEGIALVDEYNAAMEALAEEHGLTIE